MRAGVAGDLWGDGGSGKMPDELTNPSQSGRFEFQFSPSSKRRTHDALQDGTTEAYGSPRHNTWSVIFLPFEM